MTSNFAQMMLNGGELNGKQFAVCPRPAADDLEPPWKASNRKILPARPRVPAFVWDTVCGWNGNARRQVGWGITTWGGAAGTATTQTPPKI